jgi:sugar/nucleoside kinase (ribokinase family)
MRSIRPARVTASAESCAQLWLERPRFPEATEQANLAASIQIKRKGAADAMLHLADILSGRDELTK